MAKTNGYTRGVNPEPEVKKEKMEMNHKSLVHSAMEKSYEKGEHGKMSKALCCFMEKLEGEEMEALKQEFLLKLHVIAYGPHFDECTAKEIVSNMVNADGSTGEYWSIEETKLLMEKHDFYSKLDKYNYCDFYVILNMMRSDYFRVLGDKDEIYLALTNAYFNGPDEKSGKAWVRMSPQLFSEDTDD